MLGEISQLDESLGRANERLNLANLQLDHVQSKIKENRHELHVAQHNLQRGQQAIAKRLVTLYTKGQVSPLEVILGARSLVEVLNRIDTEDRVSSLDAQVISEVRIYKTAVKRHARQLKHQRIQMRQLVAQRAAEQRSVEGQLAERQQLLSSLNGEIERLLAAQQARELQQARAARTAYLESRSRQSQSAAISAFGATAATPEGATVVPPSGYSGAAGVALSYIGTPYVWAGASPGGFDCSGLVMYAYRADRRLAAALLLRAVGRGGVGAEEPAPVGRPRLLRRARPRRDLHRRRAVRAFPAHRRRREGVEPRFRLVRVLVRRRAPRDLASGRRRGVRGGESRTSRLHFFTPMRTTWNGSISFGLVSIPVGLSPATASTARQSDVQFRMLHRECLTPIKQKRWCPVHDVEVGPDELVRGWEVVKGQFVPIEDEELEALERHDTSRAIEIRRFVGAEEVDPVYFDRTYYLVPAGAEAQRRPYALLLSAMRDAGVVGIGSFVLAGKEKLALIRPKGDALALETLYVADDVKSQAEIDEVVEATQVRTEELALAEQLIGGLRGTFEPAELRSEYRAQLRELLEAKAQGRELPPPEETEPETPVIDLMDALRASVAASKTGDSKTGDSKTTAKKPAAPRKRAAAG